MKLSTNNLGPIIRGTRKAMGLSQSELAERAGCSQRLVSCLESGASADFKKVIAVLSALRIELSALPAPVENPEEELSALERKLVESLTAPTPAKPRLASFLQENS